MDTHRIDTLAKQLATRRISRRTALRGLAGGTMALAGTAMTQVPVRVGAATPPPNILVIIVDEMRESMWFPAQHVQDAQLPALARLRASSVRFTQNYAASNMCTPARGALVTGLYSHQTGVMQTLGAQASTLTSSSPFGVPTMSSKPPTGNGGTTPSSGTTAPEFKIGLNPTIPTWGTMLRQFGYQTYWYGKWHLADACGMEPYGFAGGTCPSPDGGPGQGLTVDPTIASQFIDWLQSQGNQGPWCTTVSFVNPHDIQWYPKFTRQVAGEADAPSVFNQLPPNFETPTQMAAQRKPQLQLSQAMGVNEVFGVMPYRGAGFETAWIQMLDSYLQLQSYADAQIGRVLNALEANSAVANTIVIFTADHGEYAGSHGLRGKGGGLYDEGIRVPLYVKDPTGRFATRPDVPRQQLTSSVDLAPLLLTLASGDSAWRKQPQFAYLAGRLDIAPILRDPSAPGRPFILHATDEDGYEFGPILFPFLQDAPFHVVGLRTPNAKVGLYTHWKENSMAIDSDGQQTEFYDYSTQQGKLEIANTARKDNAAYRKLLDQLINDAIPNELRAPLPRSFQTAASLTQQAYLAKVASDKAQAPANTRRTPATPPA